jgi:hypothetical protein
MSNENSEQRRRRLHRERQSCHWKKQKVRHRACINLLDEQQYININPHELERMDQTCTYCGAKFWIEEKDQCSSLAFPSFARCCAGGKVRLSPLHKPLSYLLNLYTSSSPETNLFRKNVRGYNTILGCTSLGDNVDERFQILKAILKS